MKTLLASILTLTAVAGAQEVTIDPLTAPAASLGYSLQGNGDLDWQQISLVTPITAAFQVTDDLKVGALLNYKLTDFDNVGGLLPGDPPVEDTFHNIGLPIYGHYDPDHSKWGAFGQVTPQLSSDLGSVDRDDFKLTAFIAITYDYADWLTFNVGYGTSLALGNDDYSPFAGFSYTPCDEFNLTLAGTALTASYRVSDTLILRAGGYSSGGLWNTNDIGGVSRDLGLRTYNVGVGADYKVANKIWLSAWVGASVANDISIQRTSGSEIFGEDLDSGVFGYVGIKAFEW